MTEDEAKTKWCPFARLSVRDVIDGEEMNSPPVNRWIDVPTKSEGRAHCIASECMAWRWITGPTTMRETALWDETSETSKHDGFCVLAGKP